MRSAFHLIEMYDVLFSFYHIISSWTSGLHLFGSHHLLMMQLKATCIINFFLSLIQYRYILCFKTQDHISVLWVSQILYQASSQTSILDETYRSHNCVLKHCTTRWKSLITCFDIISLILSLIFCV